MESVENEHINHLLDYYDQQALTLCLGSDAKIDPPKNTASEYYLNRLHNAYQEGVKVKNGRTKN